MPTEQQPLRILVVDDHAAVRAGLERLLVRAPDLELVQALPDDRTLHGLLDHQAVDVIVLDYDLERGDGLAACLRVKQRLPAPAVVIYSGYAGPGVALAANVAGADALISKADPVGVLLESIRRVALGARLVLMPSADLREAAYSRLRQADLAVFAMLLDRVRVAEIAETLRISERDAMSRARRVVGLLQSSRDGSEALESASAG